MKTKIVFKIFAFLIFAIITSCNNDDDKSDDQNLCLENIFAGVSDVIAPSTGTVDETITVQVEFGVGNGCGQFGRFIETQNGNSRTVEVEARYEGCICTQDAPIRTVNYQFIPKTAGIYELKFKSNSTEFVTVNITVN